MKRRLGEQRVPFSVNLVPNSTRCQMFVRDPKDIHLELKFEVGDGAAADIPVAIAHSMPGQPRSISITALAGFRSVSAGGHAIGFAKLGREIA